jgi:uncharacterized membrane protein YphA (DoxX/SURF4 family)
MNTISRLTPTAIRYLLGFIFLVSGVNGFLQFMPQPPVPAAAGAFMGALAATGYMFPLIKIVETVAGAMLLSNRFVPLALALLAPGVVNIVLFHAVLAPGGLGIAVVLLMLELVAAWTYRDSYITMLRAHTVPNTPKPSESARLPAHGAS